MHQLMQRPGSPPFRKKHSHACAIKMNIRFYVHVYCRIWSGSFALHNLQTKLSIRKNTMHFYLNGLYRKKKILLEWYIVHHPVCVVNTTKFTRILHIFQLVHHQLVYHHCSMMKHLVCREDLSSSLTSKSISNSATKTARTVVCTNLVFLFADLYQFKSIHGPTMS
jgi:hypothetical protein